MIYSVNESTVDRIALFEEEADMMLESVGVTLYNDVVAIGESVYDGADAEAFLAENGILLYEDHIVLEGQQARDYKNRKQTERGIKGNENYKDYQRTLERGTSPYATQLIKHADSKGYIDTKQLKVKDKERFDKLAKEHEEKKYGPSSSSYSKRANREYNRRVANGENLSQHDFRKMQDASNRNERRHPKNESTIFDFDLK